METKVHRCEKEKHLSLNFLNLLLHAISCGWDIYVNILIQVYI
jgi:hypothetical protein